MSDVSEKTIKHDHEHPHHDHHHDHDQGTCSCGCGHDPDHGHDHSRSEHTEGDMSAAKYQTVLHVAEMCCAVEGDQAVRALQVLDKVQAVSFNTLNRTVTVGHGYDTESPLLECLAKAGLVATVQKEDTGPRRVRLRVEALDCEVEANEIRRAVDGLALEDLVLDTRLHTVTFVAEGPVKAQAIDAIAHLGYASVEIHEAQKILADSPKIPWMKLGVAGAFALVSEIVELAGGNDMIGMGCAAVAILLAGLSTYRRGITALMHANFNMNALMSVAVTGAALIGHWPEAAMVMVLFEVSEAIEALSIDRAHKAIRSLLDLTPTHAVRVLPNGETVDVAVEELVAGDRIRVAPGENIALDGIVIAGTSSVNQAPITGESMPVEKIVGDKVYGGTTNQTGELTVAVTSDASHGIAARMLEAVEAANKNKAPTERFVDVFARYYTPAVFALSILTAVAGPFITGEAWNEWLYRALVLLVIACPCALVISTPVTIVSGLAVAARLGAVIKGGAYLEALRRVKFIALDKTGTITRGKPEVCGILPVGLTTEKHLMQMAASLADRSTHPVSQAISRWARARGMERLAVEQFKTLPGVGTMGKVGGARLQMVSPKNETLDAEVAAFVREAQDKGASVVILKDLFGVAGAIAVSDSLREGAKDAVSDLMQLGVTPVLMTGDNTATAQTMAQAVGIREVRAEMMPEDKLGAVTALQEKGPCVMVGDGINDAPALAQADIGIAMARDGSDIAIDTADVALMDDDIAKLPMLVRLSHLVHNRLVQNITMALAVKFAFMILTFMGMATMWMAVFADIGVCLIVVAWGLMVLRAEKSLKR